MFHHSDVISLPSHCPKLNGYFTSTLTCIQSKTAPPSAHFDCSGEINFLLIHKFKRRKLHFSTHESVKVSPGFAAVSRLP